MKRNALLTLALCALFFLVGWTMQASRNRYEYRTEYAPSDKKLNELGEDGWELVAVASKGGGSSIIVADYVFKRAK